MTDASVTPAVSSLPGNAAGRAGPTSDAFAAVTAAHARRRRASLAALALLAVLFVGACLHIGLDPLVLARGLPKLAAFAAAMVPPTAGGHFGELAYAVLETVAMAFAGTTLAVVIALPLGFVGAANVVRFRPLRFFVRRAFDVVRGIDVLVWALLFVSAVGLGPFAGILAIAVADGAVLAKIFAELIEGIEQHQVEGVESCGASRLAVLRHAYLPQVMPFLVSNALYYFESNTRSATILGVVGAGGIGYQLAERMQLLVWDQVSTIVLMVLAVVSAIDLASRAIQRRLA